MTLSFVGGLVFWLLDSFHMHFFYDDHLRYLLFQAPLNFADSVIFHIPPSHLISRLTFMGICLAGGAYAARLIGARTKQNKELVQNIRERDHALQKAKESEQRFKCFFEVAFEGIVISRAGIFVDFNPQLEKMLGYTREEMINRPVSEFLKKEDVNWVMERILADYPYPYESSMVHKDGTLRAVLVYGHVTSYQGEKARITVVQDVTERKKAEEKLKAAAQRERQKSKMEAIGDFSSGIAHDFNNALTPIIGGCDLLLYEMPSECKRVCQPRVASILSAATMATQLVRRMQSYTRRDTSNHVLPLELVNCLTETFEFLRSMTPTSIAMDMHVDHDVGLIMATDVTIRQILMNVVKNAIQAMPFEEGKIDIYVSKEKVLAETDKLESGTYVRIDVEDNGNGMPPEVLERALDPYYTTKQAGIGSGIGLSVVDAIVKGYRGSINIYSEEGEGTRVVIYLPSVKEKEGMEVADCVLEDIIVGNKEHIIVVDDEVCVCDVTTTILESLGYRVTAFTDSMEALEEFSKHPDNFDLLITDMTMPEMSGADLINEFRGLRPEMRIILCSGLGNEGHLSSNLFVKDIDAYMTKPVTRAQYSKTVASVLRKVKEED
jgi:PAS domain S-box-containing protein